jgi:hypothetical protein
VGECSAGLERACGCYTGAGVGPSITRILRPVLLSALAGEHVPVPGRVGYTLSGGGIDDACMVTVWAEGGEGAGHDPVPVLSLGILATDTHAQKIWMDLIRMSIYVIPEIDPSTPPATPWCAVALHGDG